MMQIKTREGNTIISFENIPEGTIVHRELMAEHYLRLSFVLSDAVYLHIGDYVTDERFGKFELTEPYSPRYNTDTAGYEYTVQFDAYYIKWKNHKLRYLPASDASETSFHLTAAIGIHLSVITNGINAIGAKDSNFRYNGLEYVYIIHSDVNASAAKYVQYDNVDFITALNTLAETFESEWWVEDNIIHFGKCKLTGNDVVFELDTNVEEMTSSASKMDYSNRIIVFGSTRNLPKDYRNEDSGDIVHNGVIQKRLMLPLEECPHGYVEAEGLSETEAIETIIIDENIYPRTDVTITQVETYEDTYIDDETQEEVTRTYYRLFADFSFENDWILEGESLHILFQSGSMNGMDFECKHSDSDGYFEVVANENYGRFLPDTDLHPSVGDKFVLYGWDSTKIGDTGLIDAAEQELYAMAIEKLAERNIDPNTYNCTMRSDWYKNAMETGTFVAYSLGQPIRLVNPTYFADGRSSRVIGYELQLDYPFDKPMYIVGEAVVKSRLQAMESAIDSLTFNGATYIGGDGSNNGSGVYIITTTSGSASSDYNVYSAKRADKQFLRKDKDDVAFGQVSFKRRVVQENGARSVQFVDGMAGAGWQIWIDENGVAQLTLDRLTVRGTMNVMEMLIEKIRSVGGQIVVSAANGKIQSVTEEGDNYVIAFEQDNMFVAHDLVRCQTFSGGELKSYWVEVSNVRENAIIIPKSEFMSYGTTPTEGDECVLMGNTTDTNRQNFISISATEDGQPRIDVIDGINSKSLSGGLRTRLGNLDGIQDSWFPIDNQPHGNGLYADNAYLRGAFLLLTGEDVRTKFEILEGRLESAISAIRQDFAEEKGYLSNPLFIDGMMKWDTENVTSFYLVGDKWIWATDMVLSAKGDGASVTTDMTRLVARLQNSALTQKNGNMRDYPTFVQDETSGKYIARPVYFSFFYRCAKAGRLHIYFDNIDTQDWEAFQSLDIVQDIEATDGYTQFTGSGLWNGTGDFKLSFSGDIYLYMLILTDDEAESLTYRYRTLFQQTDKLVGFAAQNLDQDGNILQSSGIMVKAQGTGIYAQNADGSLALIGVAVQEGGQTVIKLTADNIQLEGLVTANQNFKILSDGSIEAKNGKFKGQIDASGIIRAGSFGFQFEPINVSTETISLSFDDGFNFAGESFYKASEYGESGFFDNHTILLPESIDYAGVQCVIMNTACVFGDRYRVQSQGTRQGRIEYVEEGEEWVSRNFIVRTTSGRKLLTSPYHKEQNDEGFERIMLWDGSRAVLSAVVINNELRWFVDNASDFKRQDLGTSGSSYELNSMRGTRPAYIDDALSCYWDSVNGLFQTYRKSTYTANAFNSAIWHAKRQSAGIYIFSMNFRSMNLISVDVSVNGDGIATCERTPSAITVKTYSISNGALSLADLPFDLILYRYY